MLNVFHRLKVECVSPAC